MKHASKQESFSSHRIKYKPVPYALSPTHAPWHKYSQYTQRFPHMYTITYLCKYTSVSVFTISTQKKSQPHTQQEFFVNFYVLFVFLPTPAFQLSLPQGCFDFYKGTYSIPVNISCVYAQIQKIHIHTFHACMHA